MKRAAPVISLLLMINREWNVRARLRYFDPDCHPRVVVNYCDANVSIQSYLLAFELNPPGFDDSPPEPTSRSYRVSQTGRFSTEVPPRPSRRAPPPSRSSRNNNRDERRARTSTDPSSCHVEPPNFPFRTTTVDTPPRSLRTLGRSRSPRRPRSSSPAPAPSSHVIGKARQPAKIDPSRIT